MKKSRETFGIIVIFFVLVIYAGGKIIYSNSTVEQNKAQEEIQIQQIQNNKENLGGDKINFFVDKKSNFISMVNFLVNYKLNATKDSMDKRRYNYFEKYMNDDFFKYIEKEYPCEDKRNQGLEYISDFVNTFTNDKFEVETENIQYKYLNDKELENKISELAKKMAVFYKVCNYDEYYNENIVDEKPVVDEISNIIFDGNYKDAKKEVEDFLGLKITEINVNINNLGHTYGIKTFYQDNEEVKIAVAVNNGNSMGELKNSTDCRKNIIDSFNSSIVSCAISQYVYNQIYRHDSFQEIVNNKGNFVKREGQIFEEDDKYILGSLQSAMKSYILYKNQGDDFETVIENNIKIGFLHGRDIVKKINEYENNRGKYKNMNEFIPVLLTVFEK